MRAFYAGLLYLFLLLPSDLGAVDMVEIDIISGDGRRMGALGCDNFSFC